MKRLYCNFVALGTWQFQRNYCFVRIIISNISVIIIIIIITIIVVVVVFVAVVVIIIIN